MDFLTVKDRKVLAGLAFWSTVFMLVIIPVQIAVFSIWPIPSGAMDWIDMFAAHPVVAMLHLDILYVINNALLCVIYLGLFALLDRDQRGLALIALVLGLVGAAAYFSTSRVFEIGHLSRIYFATENPVFRQGLRAVVEGMTAVWQGTGFAAYYVLGAFSLLFFSIAMLKSAQFGRSISILALVSAVFMMIPSTAGTIGLVFSLLSLIPWVGFLTLLAPKFRNHSAGRQARKTVQRGMSTVA